MDENANMLDINPNSQAVFDINWSHDGTVVAAGFEKSVIMLDMNKIFKMSPQSLYNQQMNLGGLNTDQSMLLQYKN